MFVMREHHWAELRRLDIPHIAEARWRQENGLGHERRRPRPKATRQEQLEKMIGELQSPPRPRRRR